MVAVRNVTPWSHDFTDGTTEVVTIPAAQAGSKLVIVCAGGAIINPTGDGFTKRTTYGGGGQDVSISDKDAAGGETTVTFTLNGNENISGAVYELGPGLTFVGWSN